MAQMDEELVTRLEAIQETMGALYQDLEALRGDLKSGGFKADATALNEPLERIARYGRLFSDMLVTWTEPQD
ncbi:MAG TPA: hypothetical protein VD886_23795 [Herpetosiphonaceae bacterium]|nr:hypothetical protein [Herpetosiphonaceae bacterium]